MKIIFAEYNQIHNSVDIGHGDGKILSIPCGDVEDKLVTTLNSSRELDALAVDYPLEYARMALDGELQIWIDAVDSVDVF